MTPVARSICAIEAILNDISEAYPFDGGGGISAIRQTMTDTYEVTIPQEERADVWTYTVTHGADGNVQSLARSETTTD